MTGIYQLYSAKRAAASVGLTVAMIDYLQRSGVFLPRQPKGRRGRGCGRRYDFRDLLVLKAIKRLLDSGASVAILKASLEEFQKLKWSADPVTLEDGVGIIRYLVACRDGVYLLKDADTLVNLSKSGQLAFSFIIDLDCLHTELRASLGLPVLQHELQLM